MRRAVSSIPTDIAEGCGRNSNKEFAHFNKSSNKEEFIGASAIWSEIDRAYIENITEEDFVERLQNLRQQDFTIDEKKKAERIYQMYVAR